MSQPRAGPALTPGPRHGPIGDGDERLCGNDDDADVASAANEGNGNVGRILHTRARREKVMHLAGEAHFDHALPAAGRGYGAVLSRIEPRTEDGHVPDTPPQRERKTACGKRDAEAP